MMLYQALVRAAERLSRQALETIPARGEWEAGLPERRRQWLDLLGLDPLPPRSDLALTVTGVVERDRHVVEKLHFQPIPGCRIAANLYRPREASGRLPAVVYVCGHAQRSKCWYQEHARWFGSHGYVCIILDAIQIGENTGYHHGTYHKGWWHWISQGYTPAGVEVWAAMRALDYLQSRNDVDPDRLGITGNSGGGTISWFAGAADPRLRVVVPSCQTGTLHQHIRDRTVDGHCDCSFWVNTRGWDFTDVAALVAPRPLLVCAAAADTLFRPYAYHDLYDRVRRLYQVLGAEEQVGLVEALTPHGYSPLTRQALFAWFERHLKGIACPVVEDVDQRNEPDAVLHVYANGKPPADDGMKDIDRRFIPLPTPPDPASEHWDAHRGSALAQLRQRTFHSVPQPVVCPALEVRRQGTQGSREFVTLEFEAEAGLPLRAQVALPRPAKPGTVLVLGVAKPEARITFCAQGAGLGALPDEVAFGTVEVRGTGCTSIGPGIEWSLRRSYALLGQTLYERRTLDLLTAMAAARRLPGVERIFVYGSGAEAAVALYAGLLDDGIAGVIVEAPAVTHWDGGPEFAGVLRSGDLPHNAALLCPRTLVFVGPVPEAYRYTEAVYQSHAPAGRFASIQSLAHWQPEAGLV
jgi:cephalosporin-C deacetylase-like acetyl esterase